MRITRVVCLAPALWLLGSAGANAAILISVATSPPAAAATACAPDPTGCGRSLLAGRASENAADVPPAAIAGLVGLFALGIAFRPRKSGPRSAGFPEVSS